MAQDLAYSFAGIIKSEKQADGTLKVYGKATDDSIDIDQQICDPEWLKKAMPNWFTSGGNIREQHSSIAAGVATDYEEKADGHYITALVVDPTSVKKVETGVLKGFSIGIRGPRVIRDTKAAGGRIVDGQIVEVSIVDRPANPNAKLMLAKAAESGELMAVEQVNIPTPGEVFKSADEAVEAPVVEETAAEEIVVDETAAPEADEVLTEEVPIEQELAEAAKSLIATLNKFDQAKYDEAKDAIADLIVVEANEMKAGSDERKSIKQLLHALAHLAEWYEGEVAEGEVPGVLPEIESEDIYMSADADMDDKMCNKCNKAVAECECDSTDSEDAEDAEKSATITVSFSEAQTAEIIEKAISSAKESVEAEFTLLKSSLAEAEQKAANLEAELETAKKMTLAGGPKRAILKGATVDVSELIQKAAAYRVKANESANDPLLAKGYRELAAELEAKANSQKEN